MPVEVKGGVTQTNRPIQSREGKMLTEHGVARLKELEAANDARRSALASVAEVEAYQAEVRMKVQACFGPFPSPGALNSQVTGSFHRAPGGTAKPYTVEKVVFESLPGWFVSANLYYPDEALVTQAPAVLVLCGHDTRAKWIYQNYAQSLAKLGYVCLIADPVGAGERLQCPSSSPVTEHKLVGRQLPLTGWSMAGLQAFDAMRCVDYLVSRTDVVNPEHIGVTGTSGGGTQAVWTLALDQRITMAAPSCFITRFRRNFENELWADHEQLPPGALGLGLDIDDFLILFAPKPMVVIAQQQDYFDIRGVKEIFTTCQRIWGLFPVPSNTLELYVDTNDHQLDVDGRQAAYRKFNQAVGGGHAVVEPPVLNENPPPANPPAAFPITGAPTLLECLPSRDVGTIPGAIRSTALIGGLADECALSRGTPRGSVLVERVLQQLNMPDPSLRAAPPDFRIWEFYSQWSNQVSGQPYAVGLAPTFPARLEAAGVTGTLSGGTATVALASSAGDRLALFEASPGGSPAAKFSVERVSSSAVRVQAYAADNSPASGNSSTVRVWNFGKPSALTAVPNYPKPYGCVYAVETEPGIRAHVYYVTSVGWHSVPPKAAAGSSAILYVSHLSSDQELSGPGREALITATVAASPNVPFFAMDVRGTGESAPISSGVLEGNIPPSSGDDSFAQFYDALGEPMLGRCTWDVLRTLDMLADYGYTDVHLMGRGWGSTPAALAGLLDPRVKRVTLKNALTSWDAAARCGPLDQSWPFSRLLTGALRQFDLPDVYSDLASYKFLVQQSPWGP